MERFTAVIDKEKNMGLDPSSGRGYVNYKMQTGGDSSGGGGDAGCWWLILIVVITILAVILK